MNVEEKLNDWTEDLLPRLIQECVLVEFVNYSQIEHVCFESNSKSCYWLAFLEKKDKSRSVCVCVSYLRHCRSLL